MTRVLVTGATGFVGTILIDALTAAGFQVRAAVRSLARSPGVQVEQVEQILVGDIGSAPDWLPALTDVQFVVHLAARAHVMNDSPDNASLYRQVNVEGTRSLVAACVRAGVQRFVFQSSIKVNGEATNGEPYRADDMPAPLDIYGVSKLEAERLVLDICSASNMTPAIVRAPLVYGPGVRANFLRLMRWIDREVPLPFGAVRNHRSLVSVWNLCDLIVTLLRHPPHQSSVWMAADGEAPSTPELVRALACAMQRRLRLIAVPPSLLMLGGTLVGKREEFRRLCGSLEIDISATRSELGWAPPLTFTQGIARTVGSYLAKRDAV